MNFKVFISSDVEGVAGIATYDQVARGGHGYPRAQELMTLEANAAIAGALDGGADEVVINDSHGTWTTSSTSFWTPGKSSCSAVRRLSAWARYLPRIATSPRSLATTPPQESTGFLRTPFAPLHSGAGERCGDLGGRGRRHVRDLTRGSRRARQRRRRDLPHRTRADRGNRDSRGQSRARLHVHRIVCALRGSRRHSRSRGASWATRQLSQFRNCQSSSRFLWICRRRPPPSFPCQFRVRDARATARSNAP